jgi:N-acetylglucosamine malate deacetylase 2
MTYAAAAVRPSAYPEAAAGDRLFFGRPLPRAGHVLAVTARPGQESAELGRLLYAFRRRGASLALLSLTRGEASPLNSTCERLEVIRPWELQLAAGLLGISSLMVADYADGGLHRYPAAELTERVRRAIRRHAADLLLVIDPAGGDPDDAAVARAVCAAAEQTGVPALARMPRAARSGWHIDLGAETAAARAVQRAALAAHASQAQARPQAQPRMDRQDDREQMRWLVPPRRWFGLG